MANKREIETKTYEKIEKIRDEVNDFENDVRKKIFYDKEKEMKTHATIMVDDFYRGVVKFLDEAISIEKKRFMTKAIGELYDNIIIEKEKLKDMTLEDVKNEMREKKEKFFNNFLNNVVLNITIKIQRNEFLQ